MVAWELAFCLKNMGGLGVENVEIRNKALLIKWLWRFPNETNSLWYTVIKSKFGLNYNRWDYNIVERATWRCLWRAISSLYGHFRKLVCFKVGSGGNIRFWEDCWIGETPLAEAFPLLFKLSSFKGKNILDFIVRHEGSSGGKFNWNSNFIRNLNERETEQVLRLNHKGRRCED